MMINLYQRINNRQNQGDTIVEVMLAIAIIGIALGTAFALSTRSFHTGQNVEERGEALSLAQGQVEFLKNTYLNGAKDDLISDSSYGTGKAFCFSDTDGKVYDATSSNCTNYKLADGSSSIYTIEVTYCNGSGCGTEGVFTVKVSWTGAGGQRLDNSTVYYKIPDASELATPVTPPPPAPPPGPTPTPPPPAPPTSNLFAKFAVMQWPGYKDPPHLVGTYNNGIKFLDCVFHPDGVGDDPACPGYIGNYNCSDSVPGTSFKAPPATGIWSAEEKCSYYDAPWQIPIDPSLLKTVDLLFTNDHWGSPDRVAWPPAGSDSTDNNIIVYGLIGNSPYQINFANYCQVTAKPSVPVAGQPLTSTNILPLFWDGYTAHLVIDSNSPDGGTCT